MSVSALLRFASPLRVALVAALFGVATFAIADPTQPRAAGAPNTPAGVTAIALSGKVGLAWQPSSGANNYSVYRGTSAGSLTTLVANSVSGTTYTDTSVSNGTKYYYGVRANSFADGSSSVSPPVAATPVARTCSSGNAIVLENCFPGTTAWKAKDGTRTFDDGIEGYATAQSIDQGGSVDIKVQVDYDTPYHIEIYRSGWYGGTQGRLISTIPGLVGVLPPPCSADPSGTGIYDCSGWDSAAKITTTADWPSGVYQIKLVRDDNSNYSEFPLVIRDDGSTSSVLYGVPTYTYQAYNAFGGKSLYSGLSDPPATLTGATRAVKASFDRPYSQATGTIAAHDWFGRTDAATVGWLEQQGYDTTYVASQDWATNGTQLQSHKVFVTGAHDEYWTQSMFDAAVAARNAGTSIFIGGANTAYWKVRLEASSQSGIANRVMVGYKTIEGGPVDPSGPTSTWRDPAGPNRPENQLLGQMYVGENIQTSFPLQVSAAQGKSRIWRYTSLASLPANTTTTVGSQLVGWEWDSRVSNGLEPAGVSTVAATPVTGALLQGNGAGQAPGAATQNTTIYKAASGATVFATGTNNWWRGLGTNVDGDGEPTTKIQQATMNVLGDMGVAPTTPASGLVADPSGAPTVTSTTPASNATAVQPNSTLKVVFDRELDPSTVDDADFTLTSSGGTVVSMASSYDAATKSVTLTPSVALDTGTGYTAKVLTTLKGWNGTALAAIKTWSFTTGSGTPPVVLERTPASAATNAPTDTTVTARFDRVLDAGTVTTSTFSLAPSAGGAAIAATVTYNAASHTATLTPSARLAPSTGYTATLTTGIKATDGVAMAAASTWSFTTGSELTVSGRYPAPTATGMSPATAPRVTFSRDVDPTTVNPTNVSLRNSSNAAVAATVTYDATTRTATITPSAALGLLASYTVQVSGSVRAADGQPTTATSWTFMTASATPAAPVASSVVPASGSGSVPNSSVVRATFSLPLDAATVTAQSFTVAPTAGGAAVAAAITYDAGTQTATLTPSSALGIGTSYRATLTTAIRSTTGQPLAANVTWTFTTAACPCSLMDSLTPAEQSLPVQDYRPGAGPFSYELGTKVRVTETTQLIALKFYKSPGETGTHVGRIWSSTGTSLGTVTFTGETASGWQRQALSTPMTLSPGTTYVISVNANAFYSKTIDGLQASLTSGPLYTVADSTNGAFNATAGAFPNDSWRTSNYFVDAVVKLTGGTVHTPSVSSVIPTAASTGVSPSTTVKATFSVDVDPATITSSTFTLTDDASNAIPASVSYDAPTRTATLTPTSALDTGHAFTARLSTGVRSDDETPLPSAYSWTFSTELPAPPTVTAVSPSNGATELAPQTSASVTFSTAMDASTITAANISLRTPADAAVPATVSYNSTTHVATITPTGPLTAGVTYTGRVTTGVESSRDVALTSAYTWSFTTSQCPCQLFDDNTPAPTFGNLDVSNGRGVGAYSLELGLKIQVSQATTLKAIRFRKEANETGTHTGRLWNASGSLIASVAFTNETASGWQQANFASPVALSAGQTYVVSYGANARFGMTPQALYNQLTDGPLSSVADGSNGVFADAAGVFPTNSWGSSSYDVDAVVG